jgi:hypothetical protein
MSVSASGHLRPTSRFLHLSAAPAGRFIFILMLAVLGSLAGASVHANEFYVSPTASASGTGTLANPWRLQTALSQPAAVHPGDTIWLRGGTYTGSYDSFLTGATGNPIVVRSYSGELARLDGAGVTGSIVTIEGAHVVYRDFEVMSSSNPNPNGGQGSRPQGFQVIGADNKLVNLLVHDTGQGFGFWEAAVDSEISGSLIYYNGNSQLDHGIYTQNLSGTKRIMNNVIFRNYGFGIHAYTSGAHLNNYDIEGNASFDNGKLNASNPYKSNYLLGAGNAAASSCSSSPQVAQNPKFIGNLSYHPRGMGGRQMDLGYSTGSCNPIATGNYLVGDTTVDLGPAFGVIAITGNTFYGPVSGFTAAEYPVNTYLSSRPSTTKVFVLPNLYEPGRANIVVYNWGNQSTVNVDVSAVLGAGSNFEVRNAQNFSGAPVLTGRFSGAPLVLPLTGLTNAAPVGQATPAPNSEFNVFVLRTVVPPGPTQFYTVPPCRLVDTRNPNGPLGGPALAAGGTRTFVFAGHCGIPAGAVSVAANVAVTQAASTGFLTVYPGGHPRPLTTTINYSANRTRANNAVIGLSGAGDASVYSGQATGAVQVIIDVTGYSR